MKQNLQAVQMNKLLMGLTLGFCSATSWASTVSYYDEIAFLGGTTANETSTPHGNPTTYFENVRNPDYSYSQSVTFTSTPVPSILARSSAYSSNIDTWSEAAGILSYDIGISGPASTWVPVTFRALYTMAGEDISGDIQFGSEVINSALIDLLITGMGSTGLESTGFNYYCFGPVGCTATTYKNEHSVVGWDDTFFGINAVKGNIYGTVGILTDEFGDATATVTMQAHADTHVVGFEASVVTFSASAFIDPEFHIDPGWLSLNPGATLSLPEGVGNSITAVPLPGSLPLMLGGLGLLSAFVRRRNLKIV